MNYKKILVIQTAFLGDVILITPLLRSLKNIYPGSHIDVLVIPQTSGVLENNPNIRKIISLDKRKNKICSFFKALRELKKENYDMAVSPHSSITNAMLMLFAKIPRRIGFDRRLARLFLTDKVPHENNILKISKNLQLLSIFSDEKFNIQTELFPSSDMFLKADGLLSELKLQNSKTIAISPGSVWFTKRWPQKYYKTLINFLTSMNFKVVLIGSKNERTLCEEVKSEINCINLAGTLSVLESAAVISKCDLAITNDSGVLHIANAVKTDVLSFFGPTVKNIGYSPFRENDIVIEIDLDCRPCGSHGGKKCPLGHHNCMRNITPDYVLTIILKNLNGTYK
ncbi:MAG: lipopolysaccharide heptosyltransferase II [Candidatus Delongbacteria bacterium]|nr:lipopolysaccharide heptosyltransferase II [Candidatus Delongbacteria bacterium]MDD4204499.1 lipopolysaccharide heptosyltransferase II [Candidatus Delongbacteria bacterium]